MPLVPEGFRCAVALGFDCGPAPEDRALDAALRVAGVLGELGVRAQFFVPGQVAADGAEALAVLTSSHDVDAMPCTGAALLEADLDVVRDELSRAREALGGCPGLRVTDMNRNGWQKREDLQAIALECGFTWASTDYSARIPDIPNAAFADKNAAMLTKHQQPRWYTSGLLEIPSPGYSDAAFLLEQERPVAEFAAHLRQCLDFAHDMGGLAFAARLHPGLLAQMDPELGCLRALVEHAATRMGDPVRFATYRDLYQWAAAARGGG